MRRGDVWFGVASRKSESSVASYREFFDFRVFELRCDWLRVRGVGEHGKMCDM